MRIAYLLLLGLLLFFLLLGLGRPDRRPQQRRLLLRGDRDDGLQAIRIPDDYLGNQWSV